MFETIVGSEIELPPIFGGDETRLWPFVNLRLHIPWFYVTLAIDDNEGIEHRHMACLTRANDLIATADTEYLRIVEANVVLPGYMTGKSSWTMTPLAEIWAGIEPETQEQVAYVFVTADGDRYLSSGVCDDESALEGVTKVFQNPKLKLA